MSLTSPKTKLFVLECSRMIHDVAPVGFVVVYFRQDGFKKEKKKEKEASIRRHVCLRACVSAALYVLMSHDRRASLLPAKIRVLCYLLSELLSALNYSGAGKRLRTAI